MKLLKKNSYNQYDTIHLTVPSTAIVEPDMSKFSYHKEFSSSTNELIEKPYDKHSLIDNTSGINNMDYIPHQDYWDIKVSAKILGKDYYKGISGENIDTLFRELVDRGICKDVTDDFVDKSIVRRADNTFNIEVEGNDMDSYYDSISLISADTKLGRIDVYGEGTTTTGVVIGKNIRKPQKITIYNKIEESKELFRKKGIPGQDIKMFCEKEYGMKYDEFLDYFENRLRVELRVTDYNNLRKLYTNKSRGEVYFGEILSSPNNAISHIFNKTISPIKTRELIKSLDLIWATTKTFDDMTLNEYKNYLLAEKFMETYEGDEKLVLSGVKNMFYKDKVKISPSVEKDIRKFCRIWRTNKLKTIKGSRYTGRLTKKYKEVEKGINNL